MPQKTISTEIACRRAHHDDGAATGYKSIPRQPHYLKHITLSGTDYPSCSSLPFELLIPEKIPVAKIPRTRTIMTLPHILERRASAR